MSTPPIPKELLEWLLRHFPDRCPNPADSDREVWMAVGRAQVVRKIRLEYQQQTLNVIPE